LNEEKIAKISSKREKREKTGVSNSESDSEPTSALSQILSSIQEVLDLQVIDGSLTSHKSTGK